MKAFIRKLDLSDAGQRNLQVMHDVCFVESATPFVECSFAPCDKCNVKEHTEHVKLLPFSTASIAVVQYGASVCKR